MSAVRELLERNGASVGAVIATAEQMRDAVKLELDKAKKEVQRLTKRFRELSASAEFFKSVRDESTDKQADASEEGR